VGERSAIEWTDHTFNPVWGCMKIAPPCDHCYAQVWATRLGMPELWQGKYRTFTDAHWLEPLKWNSQAECAGVRRRVFCASMADVFDNGWPEGIRERLWELIEATPYLDWLLLTKRIGNAKRMLPAAWLRNPRPNVWAGATFGSQEELDRDLVKLLEIPAAVYFGSFEPLLGPIVFDGRHSYCPTHDFEGGFCIGPCSDRRRLDWVIVGGESGHHARPMHPAWVRSLRDQCQASGVAFLFKQWGEWEVASHENGHYGSCMPESGKRYTWVGNNGKTYNPSAPKGLDCWAMAKVGKKKAGRLLDGRTWDEFPRVTQ
jgi:protein gp37